MRLRSLTLQGFKSFGDRVTIEFSPGVTAVVGPNGSGKSNLLDALKWVTGGGRARAYRAEVRTDLIFHGADAKRSSGIAEVELELEGDDRTIRVRRDLDRGGESRLRLDGRLARFADVDDALAGSGLGTRGVATIGQGEVAGVLMADPAALLHYVAEAAGVARLAGRRERTQAHLDAAERDLRRLADLAAAERERLVDLQRDALAAAREAALRREALALRATLAHVRAATLRREVDEGHRAVGAATQALLETRERAEALRADIEAARRARTAAEARYRDALAARERREGQIALATAQRTALEGRERDARAAAQADRAEAERLRRAAPAPEGPGVDEAALAAAATRAATDERAANEASAQADAAWREVRRDLERARTAHERAVAEHAAHRERELALAEAERALRAAQAASEVDGPPPDVAHLAAERDLARSDLARAEADLADHRAALAVAHEVHATAHAEATAAAAAAAQARAAFDVRRAYATGPRAALTSRIRGVIGSVADLFEVAPEHRAAVAGALGRRAEYVVIDSADVAEAVLSVVHRAHGFATLLPLDLLRPPRTDPPAPAWPGVIGRLRDVVAFDPRYAAVASDLFGGTLLVTDLPAATAIARRERERPRLVTLHGDVIEAGGAISGGRRGGSSVLGLAGDVEAAEARATAAHAHAELLLGDRERAVAAVRASEGALAPLRERAAAAEALHRDARIDVERRRERDRAWAERAAQLVDARAALRPPAAPLGEAHLELGRLEAAAQQTSAAARAYAEAARAAAADARRAAEVGRERQRAFEVARSAHTEAFRRAAQLEEDAMRRTRDAERLAQEVATAHAAEAALRAAASDDREVAASLERAEAHQAALERAARALDDDAARLAATAEAARTALARRDAALELAQEDLRTLPEGVEPLAIAERTARDRARDVDAALAELGPVNHRAAAEHAVRASALGELERDGADAAAAAGELRRALTAIDAENDARLERALEELRGAYAEHVRTLFGPTAVGAVEVDTDAGRAVGVRLRLQPPGKRTNALELLSVGERTMGALAFLFALMAGDVGLPIAVLDEVDAPLDEANVRRFGAFVAALAERGTQFVLITHQKATFEVADTLWGVTSDRGVSRVFSIRR